MSDYTIAIKIGGQLEGSFNSALRAARGGLSGLGSSASQSATVTSRMSSSLSKGMMAAGAAAAAAAKGVMIAGKAVLDVGKYSVQVGKDFESAMSSASATANASAADYEKMKQAAMEMGKTTSKTATESAQALEYMALAGWDVDTSVSALPSVLKMSEATGMDLARASDLTTDAMAALGVTVDELPGYLDVAAKAQTKSNQTAEQLMEAYLGVGGTMKNLNVPITESATALGVLANRGIKGSEAGTALNAIMVNLTTGTGQAGKMMQQLGVSAFDSSGNFIGLEATLQQLNGALQGCSEEERNAALAAIGGKQHIDALNNLMAGLNTTNEEGVSEWAALTGELENCKGSLDAMRDTKLDNLEGDMAALQSAAQDAGIKIYGHLNAPLRDFAQFGAQAIRQVSGALEKGGFSGMAGAAGSAVADGLGKIVEHLPEFLATAAASIVTFVLGFASDLPSSLLAGLIKGIPRLLKALPQLGVNIVKAIAKGILSSGHTILLAIKKLIFGGGNDKEDAEKVGAETAKGYADGATADAPAGPGDAAAIAEASATGGETLGAGVEQVKAGIPLDSSLPVEGAEGAEKDAPAMAAAAPALSQSPVNDEAMAEAGAAEGEILKAGARLADSEISIDTASPIEKAPAVSGAAPVLQASANAGTGLAETMAAETAPVAEMPAEVAQASAEMAGAPAEIMQAPAEMGGAPEEAMQAPLGEMNMAGAEETPEIPPAGVVQETAQTQQEAIAGIANGAVTETPPAEGMPAVAETLPDASAEAMQTSAETAANVPAEAMRETAQTANAPAESREAPSEAAADTGIAGSAPETLGLSEFAVNTANAAESGAADAEAAPEASVQAGAENGLAGKLIDASKIGVGGSALSGMKSLAGALGGRSFMEGVSRNIGGAAYASQVGVDATGVNGDAAAQLQKTAQTAPAEAMAGAQANAGAESPQPEENPKLGAAHYLSTARDFIKTMAKSLNPVGAGAKMAQSVIDKRGFQDSAAGVAAKNASPIGVGFGAMQNFMGGIGMGAAQAKPAGDASPSFPEAEAPDKGSKIAEALSGLLGKAAGPNRDASGPPPSFTYSPTFNIEGSGDVKSDVEKANRMGMREFEKLMDQYLKKNKRTQFA